MQIKTEELGHHISKQFNAELEDIRSQLLAMGGQVERQVADAVSALVSGDSQLAMETRRRDRLVNQMEVAIDDECARILARRQPAASDLRLVIACSKIATDLERIGDEAAKVAKQAIKLAEEGESPRGYVECRHIGSMVGKMVHDVLTAFARFDSDMALSVAQEDESVDLEYKTAMRELVTYMMEDPRAITRVMSIIWVLRSLERIGDHARNVAEQVIYVVQGKDVRYGGIQRLQSGEDRG